MKKTFLIVIVLIIASCSSNSNKKPGLNKESLAIVKEYSTSTLIEEKFLEFYELNMLLNSDSKFKKEIGERLKSFKIDTFPILNLPNDSKITNIKQIGETISITDSIKKRKIIFDMVTPNSLKKDSLFAYILSKKIIIDSIEVISNKVKFARY
ncbi:hypothetical protein [Polaribacter cellanae]|uniref:Lipoprotein n=1 Tax=Polaribacter cellanae TaxID=2818493 RepID=A0A975H5N1_9FLAO|nr:hypothetical protein [Polaribacter cellanae]QTE21586.1 hypothetical protein J3359_12230 [Polaribacter cellanae]